MLNELLQTLGHQPTKETKTSVLYYSPFNQEKTPSFYIFPNQKWNGIDPLKEFNFKDNSSGYGGDIYKFIMLYDNIGFKQAKQRIEELLNVTIDKTTQNPNKAPSFSLNQTKEVKHEDTYKITKTSTLQNKALIDYLQNERKISREVSEKYLGEIYYTIANKNYFALSFGNKAGGREIRNKYFKGSFGKKDISLILPNPNDKRLKIFEGFMDFLSYLEINKNVPKSNYLVLNSVSLKENALKLIQSNFEAYELYLDNDRAGNETTQFFMQNLNNATDKRVHYKECKDLNEFLLNMKG